MSEITGEVLKDQKKGKKEKKEKSKKTKEGEEEVKKEKKPRNRIKTTITDVKKLVALSLIISRQKNKKQQKSEPSR